MNCVNCGAPVESNYCSQCGQRTHVKRITFREGWNDFWARVYGFDGMFPRTLRDLSLRPWVASKAYIKGNRVSYYGPVGYCFLMVTLWLLYMSMLDIELSEFLGQKQNMFALKNQTANQAEFSKRWLSILSDNIKVIVFIIVPFYAIASKYILFRKAGLNLLEHMVLPFYATGHTYWLNIISVTLFKFNNSVGLNSIEMIVMILYYGYAYTGFTDYQSKVKGFFKGMGVFLLGYLIVWTVVIIILIAIVFLFAWLNPEALKSYFSK